MAALDGLLSTVSNLASHTGGGASGGGTSNGGNVSAGQSASQSLSGSEHDTSSHQASNPSLSFSTDGAAHNFDSESGGGHSGSGHSSTDFGGLGAFSAEASNPTVSDYDTSHGSFNFDQSQQTGQGDHGLMNGLG